MTTRLAPILGAIPSVRDVVKKVLAPNDATNEKGRHTWALPYSANPNGTGRTTIFRRHQGQAVGNHFHPRLGTKDPEIFLLLLGSLTFHFLDLCGNVSSVPMDADADGPTEILIPPYLLHHVDVHTPEVWFLEQEAGPFDPDINYNEAEFYALRASLAQQT